MFLSQWKETEVTQMMVASYILQRQDLVGITVCSAVYIQLYYFNLTTVCCFT